MMLPFVKTLGVGEVCEVALTGQYLELRSAAAVVSRIELLDKSGGVVSLLEDAEATDFVRTDRQFQTLRITNGATAQALRFYYGDGDSGSNRFTGVVSGEVSLSAVTLAALEITNTRPEAHTVGAATQAALLANVAEVYLAPAANVSGAVFQYFDAVCTSTVFTMNGALLMKAGAAPVNVNDGVPLAILEVKNSNMSAGNSLQFEHRSELRAPAFVPAGFGVYWIQDSGASAGVHRGYRARVL